MLGVDPRLATAVATAESSGNPNAKNASGATGLFQLMPDTAKALGVNPNNPMENIAGGVMYLRQMLAQFGGNVVYALAAYNYGPGNVQKWIARGANFADLPAETRAYISKILNSMGSAQ